MKVLLIYLPTYYRYADYPPFGVAYIAAHLRRQKVECSLIDLNLEYCEAIVAGSPDTQDTFDELIKKHLDSFKEYDVIGFSAFIARGALQFARAYDIMKDHLKENAKVVVGGNYFKYIDNAIVDTNAAYQRPPISLIHDRIPDHHICRGCGLAFFDNLLNLPTPPKPYSYSQQLDKLAASKYTKVSVLYSTGCIHNCIFCHHRYNAIDSLWYRRVDDIINEMFHMDQIFSGNPRFKKWPISLAADNIANSPDHFNEFLSKLVKINNVTARDNIITWTSSISLLPYDQFKSKIDWENLYPSGCRMLKIGVETFSERLRAELNKPRCTNEDLMSYLKLFRQLGIKVYLYIMPGYITETAEDFQESLEFAKKLFSEYGDIIKLVDIATYKLFFQDVQGFDIEYDENGFWIYKDNTVDVRCQRAHAIVDAGTSIEAMNNCRFSVACTKCDHAERKYLNLNIKD